MSLPQFIRKHLDIITEEWKDFARTIADPSVTDVVLRNDIHQLLFYIADDIESAQSEKQRASKSYGHRDGLKESPAGSHADLRFNIGFNMVELVSEYRALRASIIRLWTKTTIVLTDADIQDLIRFNESIDQLLAQSIKGFVAKIVLQPETDFAA